MNLPIVLAFCFTLLHIGLVVAMTKYQFRALCLSWGIGILAGIIGLVLTLCTSHVPVGTTLCLVTIPSFACTAWILQNVTFPYSNRRWWQRNKSAKDNDARPNQGLQDLKKLFIVIGCAGCLMAAISFRESIQEFVIDLGIAAVGFGIAFAVNALQRRPA